MSLRSELTKITKVLEIHNHPELITQLRKVEPHTIEIVELTDSQNAFNCVMFALDLIGYIDPPCSPLVGRYYIGIDFLTYLTDNQHLHHLDVSEERALIVYRREHKITHVGVVQRSGRVRSKWGAGHLYEHGVWEVPETFGDQIDYYQPIESDDAFSIFKQRGRW